MGLLDTFGARTLAHVEARRDRTGPYGRYRYAAGCDRPTLYSSCYAAMTRELYGDLACLSSGERDDWTEYLQSHQDDDGLFRDPAIFGQGWYAGDPLWCGRPHLTCHVIIALTCLGASARKPLRWLDPFRDPDRLRQWLGERDWGERIGWTGNEVMNVGTLLQYVRDFHQDVAAGGAVDALCHWMERHHLDARTGLWGSLDASDSIRRSHAVQAAYHFWTIWTYDGRPIPHLERAVDSVLATQNPRGSFGWGIHNRETPFEGSACEDIDSIEPLCRFAAITGYRHQEALAALERAMPWVLSNRNDDGGFAFLRGQPFEYGHPLLRSERGESGMFATWFRSLSLAYIGRTLPPGAMGRGAGCTCRCPGYQF